MGYVDYEFYKDKYFGSSVPESDFLRLAERASEEVDILTFKRLRKWMPEDESDLNDVKKAICALTESIYYEDLLSSAGMSGVGGETQTDGTIRGKVISSMSSGSESISYTTGGNSTSSLEGIAIQEMQRKNKQKAIRLLNGVRYKDKNYMITFHGIGYE